MNEIGAVAVAVAGGGGQAFRVASFWARCRRKMVRPIRIVIRITPPTVEAIIMAMGMCLCGGMADFSSGGVLSGLAEVADGGRMDLMDGFASASHFRWWMEKRERS